MQPTTFPQLANPIQKNRIACAGSRDTAPSTLIFRGKENKEFWGKEVGFGAAGGGDGE